MDARLVRAFLDALPESAPDSVSLTRVRGCLASLQDPDVRYLVATVLGPASPVARTMAAVLSAAGARTATLGRSLAEALVDGAPIDDALLGQAGTLAASAAYQLHKANPALGELTRREGIVLLALIAFAESGQRVALLLDEDLAASDPVHAPKPDLVVITQLQGEALGRALELVPEGRPVACAALETADRAKVEAWAERTGAPLLLGERDHDVREEADHLVFRVRGEPYVTFAPVAGLEPAEIGCALAGALALGVMGIRMREDWVTAGLDTLRPAAATSVAT